MLSDRIRQMAPSQTLELNSKIARLRSQGKNIIALNSGEPDYNTPRPIIDAATRAMLEGRTKYTQTPGIPELREAIVRKFQKDNGIEYGTDEILVSTGAKYALTIALQSLCNPGDEVIIPTPCWVSYVEMIKLAGGIPVLVPVREDNQLDMDKIRAAVTGKTRILLINSPNNPTGAVYPKETMKALTALTLDRDLYLISDEVYEKLIYGSTPHVSPASFSQEIRDRTITVNAFSKSYSMT
ncbi:MAG TPA: aminotransferase class I/II-fold pyridoxal phosphate-dependent enzyme, partial [Clostridiaceae bacterium]|nr:aminotransferase class I/II-fold pyridoxal phosphate-dependent enzyme [Clostridiaceae bacterium]